MIGGLSDGLFRLPAADFTANGTVALIRAIAPTPCHFSVRDVDSWPRREQRHRSAL
jgi:hypothetical protein